MITCTKREEIFTELCLMCVLMTNFASNRLIFKHILNHEYLKVNNLLQVQSKNGKDWCCKEIAMKRETKGTELNGHSITLGCSNNDQGLESCIIFHNVVELVTYCFHTITHVYT
jgi:hypothetical protein